MEAKYALRSEASKWNFNSEPFGWKNFTEVDFPEFKAFEGSNTAGEEFALAGSGAGHRQDDRAESHEDALREIARLKLCRPTLDVRTATGAFEIRGCQPSITPKSRETQTVGFLILSKPLKSSKGQISSGQGKYSKHS